MIEEKMRSLDWHDASIRPSNDDIGKLFWIYDKDSKYFYCYTPVIYNGDWVCPMDDKTIPYDECVKWFKLPVESKLYYTTKDVASNIETIEWFSTSDKLPPLITICSPSDGNTIMFKSRPLTVILDAEYDGKHHYSEYGDVYYRSDGNWYYYDVPPEPVILQSGSDKLKLNVAYWTYTLSVGGNFVSALKRGDIH